MRKLIMTASIAGALCVSSVQLAAAMACLPTDFDAGDCNGFCLKNALPVYFLCL